MNPLDALSSLSSAGGIGNLALNAPSTPGMPGMPGAPVTEGFSSLLPSASSSTPAVASLNATPALESGGGSPSTWGHMVQQMVMDANSQQQSATAKVNDVLQGGPTPVHDAMIATEQASLSFEFLAEVRNKITDAYQQVMQMQV
jgi:flagellar hook-basal body complex protein FliE